MRSSVALETELQGLTDEELLQMKHEIEVRLARFQKAFLEHHGRNPDEHGARSPLPPPPRRPRKLPTNAANAPCPLTERAPAKPAIKRYRAVCKELSIREQARPGPHVTGRRRPPPRTDPPTHSPAGGEDG